MPQTKSVKLPQNRTTPAGLWRFGRDYCDAANLVSKAKGERYFEPAYFMHGRSIELVLKAFLLASGIPYKKLRNPPYGHDLNSLLKESRRHKLGRFVSMSKQDRASVSLFNDQYSNKRFEYIVTGSMTLPSLFSLQFLNVMLVAQLRQFSIDKTYGKGMAQRLKV